MKTGTVKMWGYKLSQKSKTAKKKNKKNEKPWVGMGKFFPHIAITLVLVLILVLMAAFLKHYFLNSETFKVKQILVNKSSLESFTGGEKALKERYLARNIFSVIPSQAEMLLRAEYPYLKMIRIRRVFPDTIEVDLVSRESFACVDTSGGMIIDKGGMVLSVGFTPEGIVKIKGFNSMSQRPRPGVLLEDKGVADALEIIDSVFAKTRIKRSELATVDISDKSNIWINLKGVPINLGGSGFSPKIDTLRDILGDPKVDLSDVHYIDLRFKDPVYSYKRR